MELALSSSASKCRLRTTRGLGSLDQAVKAIVVEVVKLCCRVKAVSMALSRACRRSRTRASWSTPRPQGRMAEGLERHARRRRVGCGKQAGFARTARCCFIHGTFSNAAAAFQAAGRSPTFFDRVSDDRTAIAFSRSIISRSAARPNRTRGCCSKPCRSRRRRSTSITHSRGGLVLRDSRRAGCSSSATSGQPLSSSVVRCWSRRRTTARRSRRRQRWDETVGWLANLLETVSGQSIHDRRRVCGQRPRLAGPARRRAIFRVCMRWMADGELDRRHSRARRVRLPMRTQRWSRTTSRPATLLRRLVDAGIDQFFSSANDLVVPSEGGWRIDRLERSSSRRDADWMFRTGRQHAGRRIRPRI